MKKLYEQDINRLEDELCFVIKIVEDLSGKEFDFRCLDKIKSKPEVVAAKQSNKENTTEIAVTKKRNIEHVQGIAVHSQKDAPPIKIPKVAPMKCPPRSADPPPKATPTPSKVTRKRERSTSPQLKVNTEITKNFSEGLIPPCTPSQSASVVFPIVYPPNASNPSNPSNPSMKRKKKKKS